MISKVTKDHRPGSLALRTDRQFFRCLRMEGGLSRASIAQITGISKPTVSESAQRLLDKKLIVESSYKDITSSKRPSIIYEINPDFGMTIGVALEENTTWIQACDFQGGVLSQTEIDYAKGRNQYQFVNDLLSLIETTLQTHQRDLLAMGVSIADPVNPQNGAVIQLPFSPFPLAHGINFAQIINEKFGCPVTVDNDVNWSTVSECKNNTHENFAYFHLGRGIGAGFFLNKHIIRGNSGLAGEIGYLRFGTMPALLEDLYNEAFYDHAIREDLAPIQETLKTIGQIIAITCVVTDPEVVILGGKLSQYPSVVSAVTSALTNSLITLAVSVSSDPKHASLKGASYGANELILSKLNLLDPELDIELRGFSTESH